MTFYYRILGDALNGSLRPTTINGLAVFSKRVVLCGGKACAKTFRSTQELPPSEGSFCGRRADRPSWRRSTR